MLLLCPFLPPPSFWICTLSQIFFWRVNGTIWKKILQLSKTDNLFLKCSISAFPAGELGEDGREAGGCRSWAPAALAPPGPWVLTPCPSLPSGIRWEPLFPEFLMTPSRSWPLSQHPQRPCSDLTVGLPSSIPISALGSLTPWEPLHLGWLCGLPSSKLPP